MHLVLTTPIAAWSSNDRYLISKYDPAKQQATEEMLVRFAGREDTLLRGVEERFGIDYSSGGNSDSKGRPIVPATPRLLAAAAAAAEESSTGGQSKAQKNITNGGKTTVAARKAQGFSAMRYVSVLWITRGGCVHRDT